MLPSFPAAQGPARSGKHGRSPRAPGRAALPQPCDEFAPLPSEGSSGRKISKTVPVEGRGDSDAQARLRT